MSFEINWFVVAIRLIEGFLNGTGFVLAVLLWYAFVSWLAKLSKKAAS